MLHNCKICNAFFVLLELKKCKSSQICLINHDIHILMIIVFEKCTISTYALIGKRDLLSHNVYSIQTDNVQCGSYIQPITIIRNNCLYRAIVIFRYCSMCKLKCVPLIRNAQYLENQIDITFTWS